MYIVSSFRGVQQLNQIYFCNRFRIAEATSPEWKVGRGRWMEKCGRGAAVVQLTARGMLSIPAMGGNRRKCNKRKD